MRLFFDSNVLVYAQTTGEKSRIARQVLQSGGVISVQVVNEFSHVASRKIGKSWAEIEIAIRNLLKIVDPPLPITAAMSSAARDLAARHKMPFYDSLIVAAAIEAQCETLLTEDMQTGRRFGSLHVVNPFTTVC